MKRLIAMLIAILSLRRRLNCLIVFQTGNQIINGCETSGSLQAAGRNIRPDQYLSVFNVNRGNKTVDRL